MPQGAVRTTNDEHLAWDVPYEPGTLKAVGMKGGKASEAEISTTGDPASIDLSVDRASIRADRRDVSHIDRQSTRLNSSHLISLSLPILKGGKPSEAEISTTGDPASIDLSVDRASLLSPRRDVSH